jgi:leader peptidase (prepilin peptidase) / N-methyltransferase
MTESMLADRLDVAPARRDVVASGLVAALVVAALAPTSIPFAALALVAVGAVLVGWAAGVDRRVLRLPNPLVGAVTVSGLAAAAVNGTLPSALAAGAIGLLPYLALHLAHPAGFGFGDVKFSGACGILVGVVSAGMVLVMLAVAFLLAAVLRAREPSGAIALGPTIAAGGHAALICSAALVALDIIPG